MIKENMNIEKSVYYFYYIFQEYTSGIAYVSFVCTLTFVLSYNIGLGKIHLMKLWIFTW